MARPARIGLEYYPKDVDMYNDRKIKRLIRSNGLGSATIWEFILCEIYREHGYYITYDDDFIFDIADILSIEEDEVKNVVKKCLDLDLFNKEKFDQKKILTSTGIQNRYLLICKMAKRKNQSINEEFRLVSSEETLETEQKNDSDGVNSELTGVSSEETRVSSESMLQRKEKERKEKERERKEKEIFDSLSLETFIQNCLHTLGKIRPYVKKQEELPSWLNLQKQIVQALTQEKQEVSEKNVHNLFCLLFETLGKNDRDRENFTIPYLSKHFNRILGMLVDAQTKKKLKQLDKR